MLACPLGPVVEPRDCSVWKRAGVEFNGGGPAGVAWTSAGPDERFAAQLMLDLPEHGTDEGVVVEGS